MIFQAFLQYFDDNLTILPIILTFPLTFQQ